MVINLFLMLISFMQHFLSMSCRNLFDSDNGFDFSVSHSGRFCIKHQQPRLPSSATSPLSQILHSHRLEGNMLQTGIHSSGKILTLLLERK